MPHLVPVFEAGLAVNSCHQGDVVTTIADSGGGIAINLRARDTLTPTVKCKVNRKALAHGVEILAKSKAIHL